MAKHDQNADLATTDTEPSEEQVLDVTITDQDLLPFKMVKVSTKEDYAYRIAVVVLLIFGIILANGFRLPGKEMLPYIQGVWGVFGSLLTFVLGYFFGGTSQSGANKPH